MSDLPWYVNVIGAMADELESLRTRLEAAEKDAAQRCVDLLLAHVLQAPDGYGTVLRDAAGIIASEFLLTKEPT